MEDEVKWAESQRDFLREVSPAQDLATASVLILTPTGLVPLNDAISDASTELSAERRRGLLRLFNWS